MTGVKLRMITVKIDGDYKLLESIIEWCKVISFDACCVKETCWIDEDDKDYVEIDIEVEDSALNCIIAMIEDLYPGIEVSVFPS